MSGNASKRGFLRPGHTGRVPLILVVAVAGLVLLFLYNVYSNASSRADLQLQNDDLREQTMTCYKGKLEVEQKLESLTKTCKRKSVNDDEKLVLLRSSNKETNDKVISLKQELSKANSDLAEALRKQEKLKTEFSLANENLADLRQQNAWLNETIKNLKSKNMETSNDPEKAKQTSLTNTLTEKKISTSEDDIVKKSAAADDIVFQRSNLREQFNSDENNDTDSKPNNNNNTVADSGDWNLSNKLAQDKLILDSGNKSSFLSSARRDNDPRYVVQKSITKPSLDWGGDRREMDAALLAMGQETVDANNANGMAQDKSAAEADHNQQRKSFLNSLPSSSFLHDKISRSGKKFNKISKINTGEKDANFNDKIDHRAEPQIPQPQIKQKNISLALKENMKEKSQIDRENIDYNENDNGNVPPEAAPDDDQNF